MGFKKSFIESGGKFTLFGTNFTLFPLQTLPFRTLQFFGYCLKDIKHFFPSLHNLIFKILTLVRMLINKWLLHYSVIKKEQVNSRQIVIVSDRPRSRDAKIAATIKAKGWEVILLYSTKPNYELSTYFSRAIRYHTSWHALYKALNFKPLVYHVFTDANDYQTAYIFCKYKPGKIICDFIDTIVGILSEKYLEKEKWRKNLIPQEKYILENADGLCCRDLQVQVTCRSGGYKRTKRTILFPEYCWDPGNIILSPRISDSDNSIHIVLIGHFGIEKAGSHDTGYLDIIRSIIRQGIHFHIYPHQNYSEVYYKNGFDSIFEDYLNLEKENPLFHIHSPVRVEEIPKEISQYDFGIHAVRAHVFDEDLQQYNVAARKIGGSSRIPDYLEAGLPIMSVSGSYFYQYLDRFGIMINLTKDNLSNIKDKLYNMMSNDVRKRVGLVRDELSLSKNVDRLTTFYRTFNMD